eukprot:TRINITY_DN42915_c0_g1_i1.p1 TRINITY_DN42915_c0_g1~~TRINITY_DN42915_c0_g1_i1.p1  ORF type:complete len:506 (+),score=57.05 TRINITY_DN42915_c0_g1_i1:68-1519(+)
MPDATSTDAARSFPRRWRKSKVCGARARNASDTAVLGRTSFRGRQTAIVYHPFCQRHLSALEFPHPEASSRFEALCGERGILRSPAFRDLQWHEAASPACAAHILRVHDFAYVKHLHARVCRLQEENDAAAGRGRRRALSSKRAKPEEKPLGCDVKQEQQLDRDTLISEESWDASRYAAGCIVQAVTLVCERGARNAFCAVRPPGHHVGPSGACEADGAEDSAEGMTGTQGFCLLNNVAIGAAFARYSYGYRIAIVDFDVHHGNGTENIVRNRAKPWLDWNDEENVFFASIHGYDGHFYPRSGLDDNKPGERKTWGCLNVPLKNGFNAKDFRDGVANKILPRLWKFEPDILFLSAGFDGHVLDPIGKQVYAGLTDDDYTWFTNRMLAVANSCCQGRLISVLEGGYNVVGVADSQLACSVAAHVKALMKKGRPLSQVLTGSILHKVRHKLRKRGFDAGELSTAAPTRRDGHRLNSVGLVKAESP